VLPVTRVKESEDRVYQTEIASPPEQIASEINRSESVAVEIYDQVYRLRGIDAAYIEQLAAVVDSKMRAVSAAGTVDSLRVAVLASLNLADELQVLRERYTELAASVVQAQAQVQNQVQTQTAVRTRSASLAHMLDQVLDEFDAAPVRRAG
jgi:cell division protein ZapA